MGIFSATKFARNARIAAIAVLSSALMFGGASVALAEGANTPDVSPSTEPTAPVATEQPAEPQAPAEQPPAEQPPAETPPPAKSTPPSERPAPPAEATPPAEQSTPPAEQPAPPADDADEATQSRKAEVPALRWQAIDAEGRIVAGTTLTLQGPRDADVTDRGNDEQWADSPEATVLDNVGQANYDGADLDPAPGLFRIESFADDDTPDVSVPVDVAFDYRVRVLEADGFLTADATDWASLTVLTDDTVKPTDVTLQAAPAARSNDAIVTPMLVGPDGPGVTKPYLYWEVRDTTGNALRGGATLEVQGPRTSNYNWWRGEYNVKWNSSVTVTDCVSTPCTGADQDPDPGEFLVMNIGSHRVSDSNRYRVRQQTAPAGYTFTDTNNDWVTIPGSRNTPSGWTADGTYDFGDFMVKKIPPMSPVCTAGQIYGVTAAGQLRAISSAGVVTPLGTKASGVSIFNGLGIGSGGSPVYAIERTDTSGTAQNATVWVYNTTTGVWATTSQSTSSLGGNSGTNMVGGAVDLKTGLYYFGGFTSDGDFKVYQYNPSAATKIKFKGTIVTESNSSANGDIAFNANGDLFVVHGNGNQTTIYSVTAANLAAANGGNIASSKSATVTTMTDVNGVAFDSAGRAYLGSGSQMKSFAMPGFTGEQNVVTSGLGTSDLASCSSPATITVQKFVQGGRVSSGDQFKLTLSQGTTELGTAVTTGSAVGLQNEQVGPQPTVRGVTLSFKEAAAGTTVLSNYVSSWTCLADGEPMSNGQGTSGSVTIPASGDVIECRITNAPLIATVNVSKTVLDTNGENPQPGAGWTVGAAPSLATIVSTPTGITQSTNAQGNAAWSLKFKNAADKTNVSVSEVQKPGYEFVSGQCLIESLDGSFTEVDLQGPAAQALTDIKPGDDVDCAYVNKKIPGSISWQKVTNDTPATNIGGSTWTVQGPDIAGPTATVADCVGANAAACAASADKDHRAGYLQVTGLAWGTYTITETIAPDGFELDTTPRTVIVTAANAQAGATMNPVVNVRKLGTAGWTKVADGTTTLLGGSEWTITGPGFTAPNNVIVDCVAASDAECTGLDKDSDAGVFKITGLAWGSYTIVETAAPFGYIVDSTPHTFTIDKTTVGAAIALGAFENSLGTPPTLPLTGGLGGDFYSFLGLGVLLLAIALLITRRVWLRQASRDGGAMSH
ncbi:Probable surface-anchored fimbrial subunit [Microbacterium esteraromaticum]|uniref:Probable surface-anchored fimbrial subunit n=1 Tax=Microbacterium esteraromaticum TaxID=57043 RepID=A0A1R4K996_9MICO|nr:SpaA isopeptide-forming pilin-related protein [Microbacterium esteraromaticum]SJN40754.1 Probable surface-anchored fimbrial subunit [Microbacterium esteraromaticum]